MKKNLIASNKNSSIALARTKNLLNITNKLLANSNSELVDDSWIERLWKWADENDIPDSELRGIPRCKKKLVSLENLNLISLNLISIPIEIANLNNLKKIILAFNKIKEIPESFYQLNNLVELNLSNNYLAKLSSKIDNFQALKELYIQNNNINTIPKTIDSLSNLKIFWLDKTINLTEVQKKFLKKNKVNKNFIYFS